MSWKKYLTIIIRSDSCKGTKKYFHEGIRMDDVTVIIPAYNEAGSIESTVRNTLQEPLVKDLVVVDDGSVDNQSELALVAGAKVIRHPYNIGNGAAIKTGIRSSKGDVFVFMDADGQHDTSDIV